MAGTLSATAAVVSIFLLFFTLAHASVSFDLPVDAASMFLPNSATETKYVTNDPETGITNKAESQPRLPANEIDTEIKSSSEKETKTETGAEMKTGTVPLTVISFRPINRHFPRLPFMRRGHKCRHQFQHGQIKPWMMRDISPRERSYGNDMILAGDGWGDGMRLDLVSHGADVRTIPATFSRFRKSHHEHDEHDYQRQRHHDHRRVEGEEYERDERERKHDHGHKHKGDFLRKIRKFLNGF